MILASVALKQHHDRSQSMGLRGVIAMKRFPPWFVSRILLAVLAMSALGLTQAGGVIRILNKGR